MLKVIRTLKNIRDVLTLSAAVLAAAIVAYETYESLRKKVTSSRP
jgi:hypothetical protein